MTDNKLADLIVDKKELKREKSRIAARKYYEKKRQELGLTSEEIEQERKRKISEAVRKRYEDGFENKKLSPEQEKIRAEKASKTMKEKYSGLSKEERTPTAAIEANKGAKRSEKSKTKMSEARKKYEQENPKEFKKRYEKMKKTSSTKTDEEKEMIQLKQSESHKERWTKIEKEDLIIRNKKISNKLTGSKRSEESKKKQSISITGRKLSDEHKQAIADSNTSNGSIKSKWYDVQGIRCQGGSEKMFVEKCLLEGKKIVSHPASFKTPHGYYRPDFIVDGVFTEIKSSWTYKQFLLKNQYNTLKWVNDNLQKVELYIVDDANNIHLQSI